MWAKFPMEFCTSSAKKSFLLPFHLNCTPHPGHRGTFTKQHDFHTSRTSIFTAEVVMRIEPGLRKYSQEVDVGSRV
jgi:hypothetical protein